MTTTANTKPLSRRTVRAAAIELAECFRLFAETERHLSDPASNVRTFDMATCTLRNLTDAERAYHRDRFIRAASVPALVATEARGRVRTMQDLADLLMAALATAPAG